MILHAQLADPRDWNLPLTSRLEVITELDQAPEPLIKEHVLRQETDPQVRALMLEPDFVDQSFDFGVMQIGLGRVFSLSEQPAEQNVSWIRVAKRLETITGRKILFESVELPDIQAALEALPAFEQANVAPADKSKLIASTHRVLPLAPRAEKEPKNVLLAQATTAPQKGLVIDYLIIGTVTNFTFRGDLTYYCGQSFLSGATKIEGGTVVKFNVNSWDEIHILGTLDCQTSAYRPAIFTGKDDDAVGEIINVSNGTPVVAGYGGYALSIDSTNSTTLNYLRIDYIKAGIVYRYGGEHFINNSQFGFGQYAVMV